MINNTENEIKERQRRFRKRIELKENIKEKIKKTDSNTDKKDIKGTRAIKDTDINNIKEKRTDRRSTGKKKVSPVPSSVIKSTAKRASDSNMVVNRPSKRRAPSGKNNGNGRQETKEKIRIIPLGGIDEIGKNMTAIEFRNEIIVIDCGLKFPDDEMFGIDAVIPDISYLIKNKEKVKGFFITHGHEDHIGALPYILKQLNVPVYATKLTLGLIEVKLREHKLFDIVKLNTVRYRDVVKLNDMKVEFIKTNHSVADAAALAIHTDAGVIVHTGDFKVDLTPVDGDVIDLARFARLGEEGVLALMADSTNVEKPGYTFSESTIGQNFERIFLRAKGRIIVATFSSNIHRIQQIAQAAIKLGRKCAFSGRSMENTVTVARELGYLNIEDKNIIKIDEIGRFRDEQVCIMTTGSQGEPMSALTRMAMGEHRKVTLKKGDMVILSSHPIPGNEKSVSRTINLLYKMGVDVIYEAKDDVHVSGHACQEELKLMQALTKPKYFIPVHGEYRHLKVHAELSKSMGRDPKNIVIPENGSIIEVSEDEIRKNGNVPSGQVLVDGLGVGDVGNIILRDRKHLSMDGILTVVASVDQMSGSIIAGPDVISRGFIFVKENEVLMEKVKDIVREILYNNEGEKRLNTDFVKNRIKEELKNYLWERTMRKPMIVPIIMEI